MDSPSILFHPTRSDGPAGIRRARQLLARLHEGWRPDDATLANAHHAERWRLRRDPDSIVYQFVGHRTGHDSTPFDHASMIIGSALAIAPQDGWALLASNAWVTLGTPLPDTPPFDPADVLRRAENWLRMQAA